MSDYLSEIYEILSQPKTASNRFREHFRHVLTKLTAEHSEIFSPKITEDFVEFLEKDKWNVIRQWIAQSDRIDFESYLLSRAKIFFRERRKALKTAAIGNTPWSSVIERSINLPLNDRILATYCLVDGLSGNALKRAVRSDVRLRIETTGAISTSRSNLLNKLLAYCHPDDREMIIAVKNVRQRSGRRRIT